MVAGQAKPLPDPVDDDDDNHQRGGSGRPPRSDHGGGKSKGRDQKRRPGPVFGGSDDDEEDGGGGGKVEQMARNGTLKSLNMSELKDYLRSQRLPVSGKKDDLLERISRHVCS